MEDIIPFGLKWGLSPHYRPTEADSAESVIRIGVASLTNKTAAMRV